MLLKNIFWEYGVSGRPSAGYNAADFL